MFTQGQIVLEILLVNPSKGAQEIPYRCPQSLNRVGVDLPDAIPVILAGPFFGSMTDGAMPTLDPRIALPLISVAAGLPLRIAVDMRPKRDALRVLAYPQATTSGLSPDRPHHRWPIILIGAVSPPLVGVPPGRIGGVGVSLPFFPPHSGTSQRSPCQYLARRLLPTSYSRWLAPSAVRDAPCSDTPPAPRPGWHCSPLCRRHGSATPLGEPTAHSRQTRSRYRGGCTPGRSAYSGNRPSP